MAFKTVTYMAHSLELTASLPWKMDGWKTIASIKESSFSGAILVSGRVTYGNFVSFAFFFGGGGE